MKFLSDSTDTTDVVKKEYVDAQDTTNSANMETVLQLIPAQIGMWQESYNGEKVLDLYNTMQFSYELDTKIANMFANQ